MAGTGQLCDTSGSTKSMGVSKSKVKTHIRRRKQLLLGRETFAVFMSGGITYDGHISKPGIRVMVYI